MGFCEELSTEMPIGGLGLFSFVFAIIQVLTVILILTWLWRQRRAAARGVESASHSLLFPVYEWILWFFAGLVMLQAISSVLLPMRANLFTFREQKHKIDITYSTVYATVWGSTHAITEGIAFLLLQHGAGVRAQKVAAAFACVWGVISWVVHFYAYYQPPTDNGAYNSFLLTISWEGVLSLFYFVVWAFPQSVVFRRPALVPFALFWLIFRLSNVASITLQYEQYSLGQCIYVFSSWAMFGVLKPFIIYQALLADSRYWLGVFVTSKNLALSKERERSRSRSLASSRSSRSQSSSASRSRSTDVVVDGDGAPLSPVAEHRANHGGAAAAAEQKSPETDEFYRNARRISYDVMSPLLGQQLDTGTARRVAAGMDGVRGDVPVLNFSYLSLGKDYHILGAGGTSRVYRGRYKGTPVAIKIIYCMDLTPDVVNSFYEEARVLARLEHKRVVHLHGICVIPPSLCLVMELCRSNLFDLLHRNHFKGGRADTWASPSGSAASAGGLSSSVEHKERGESSAGRAQLTSWATKLSLALGCAEGVAFLHAQHPTIVHTDIKSLNFLVTSDLEVRICDLEHCIYVSPVRAVVDAPGRHVRQDNDNLFRSTLSARRGEPFSHVPETLNWCAPEIIRSAGSFTCPSDVYSLGVVLWEILTGEIPFANMNQYEVRRALLQDSRYHPPVTDVGIPRPLVQLLLDCWRRDPHTRPSSADVVNRLARIKDTLDSESKPGTKRRLSFGDMFVVDVDSGDSVDGDADAHGDSGPHTAPHARAGAPTISITAPSSAPSAVLAPPALP